MELGRNRLRNPGQLRNAPHPSAAAGVLEIDDKDDPAEADRLPKRPVEAAPAEIHEALETEVVRMRGLEPPRPCEH